MDAVPASIALPAATISYVENEESAPTLRSHYASGHMATAAVEVPPVPFPVTAQGLGLGPAAAPVAAAGRDENIVRALSFAKKPAAAAIPAQAARVRSNGVGNATVNGDSSGTTSRGGNGHGRESTNAFSSGEAVTCEKGPGLDETLSRSDEASGLAVTAGGNAAADSINTGSVNSPAPTRRTEASWHDRHGTLNTTSSNSSSRSGLAESGNGVTSASTATGFDARVDGATAAGNAGDESDVGSEDDDNDYFTWFSSQRRVSSGQRKHGRGKPRGDRVYDSVRINDHAEEMSTLRQQLAEGTVEESEGRKKLRELEDKIYTIKVGDAVEIHSGNNYHPFVGTLILLDREKKMLRVRWFYLGHEVEDYLAKEMGPKEILMCNAESDLYLSTVKQKVETVPEMSPNGEALPANTYLCYRGYDKRRKDFAPLLADGSLGRSLGRPPLDRRSRRRKPKSKKARAHARASVSSRTRPERVGTPQRSSSSSTIMSPSQDDSDGPELILLKRWNRVGPEFDVDVSAWTGPSTGRLTPPPQERNAVQRQLDLQQEWSSDRAAAPFDPETLKKYLNTAKVLAPIFPGTIVYIRPRADGLWGDEHDPKHARSNGVVDGNAGLDGSIVGAEVGPRLSSASRSTFRWGLVSEPPSPEEQQLQLARQRAQSRGRVGAGGGASYVGMTQRVPGGDARVGMPSAPQPQWFTQQQQQLETGVQQQQQRVAFGQHQFGVPYYQLAMQHQQQQEQQQQHALRANFNNLLHPQQQVPANSLARQDLLQQGAGRGNFANPSLAKLEGSPESTLTAYENPHRAPTSAPDVARGDGIERVVEGSVVWIANPSEGKPPLQVERSRVMAREFEEEAMNVLWDARGDVRSALEIIYSKKYQDALKVRLAARGEIWTSQQVKAAVKKCNAVVKECRETQLGDEGYDEAEYGVVSKPFHSVVDFGRRFNSLPRFGQPVERRACVDRAVEPAETAKRQRPKQGTSNDTRPKKQEAVEGGDDRRGGGRNRGQAVRNYQEVEEEEEEEEEAEDGDSEDSDDANYNPDDSEGSSLIFVRGKKRRRTTRADEESAEEAAGSTSGYSSDQEDRKDNVVIANEEKSQTSPTAPTFSAPSDEIYDLCSSGDEDDDFRRDVRAKEETNSAGSSSGTRGRIVRRKDDGSDGGGSDRYQTLAPATAAEVAAEAAVHETQGIAAEAAAKAEADGAQAENGGPAAAEGGGGGAGVPRTRDDSPVPGVASGNTGGEAIASRPADETGSVLHAFMDRVKATLNKESFDKFVSALSQYREQHLAIDQLVDVVGECFNHREVPEIKLIDEFNTFLPPGHAVRCTKT